ncbi:hypothetical protein [Yersinia frederiksenii]|uniref:hypothetical protein n=1 Tax=Yersinia frederiksenii TaxID=29484 RepID=UPI0001A53963|nr:hypothetical protein [Yersinia frederiksenii]EEQ13759.1 hypothetical protein yfred0001_28910 [Yersinia frederiksenii ATCC 33641]MDN0118327.1 hypothetical protein [Yersinia frederiksenii]
MDDSLPDFACFVGMALRFRDQLSIRQQFSDKNSVYKMVESYFSDIKKPGETPGFYH